MGNDDRRKAMIGFGFGALVLVWVYLRVGLAYDDLDHYGVDRPSHAGLGQGLAAIGALASLAVVVAVAQRHVIARLAAWVAAVAGFGAGAYVAWVGGSNGDKVGFESGSLVFLGLLVMGYSLSAAWRATQLAAVADDPPAWQGFRGPND